MDCSMASTMLLRQENAIAVPQLRLSTGIYRVDQFLDGFYSSHLYHATGTSQVVQDMCTRLMVQVVQQFDGSIVYLDGGNSIDPYHIARRARSQQADADSVLSHIHVARAFTAYQLDTLINRIPDYVQEFAPQLVIVNCVTDLLHDKDVPRQEAHRLLHHWLPRIKQQAAINNHVALVTSRTHDSFSHLCRRQAYDSYSFNRHGDSVRVTIADHQQPCWYQPVSLFQATLEDFMEEPVWAEQ
ncbi:MAG: hypothetical protein ACP5FL_07970 [Thermoplasmatota archaeon]